MRDEQERFARASIQAFREWMFELGPVAWVIAGLLLAAAVILSVYLRRWILRGGLQRHRRFR